MSNLKHIFGQFRGPRPTLWRLEMEALHLQEFGFPPPNTWLLLSCVRCVCVCVCVKNQLDRSNHRCKKRYTRHVFTFLTLLGRQER